MKQFLSIKNIFYYPLILLAFGCNSQSKFSKLKFNWTEDYYKEISKGLQPNNVNTSWCMVRYSPNINSELKILYKSKNFDRLSIKKLSKGFLVEGHPSDRFYYIVVLKNKRLSYLTNLEDVLSFLGTIDTVEEGLIIAKIMGFKIDYNDLRGSSYRKVDNRYQYLLMKDEGKLIGKRQYLITINYQGKVSFKKNDIYCKGSEKCYFD